MTQQPVRRFSRWRWFRSSLIASLVATIAGRRPTLVYRDRDGDVVHRWKGGLRFDTRIHGNPAEEGAVNWQLFTREYCPKPGDIVLDLGCGVGTELVAFSRAVGPSGKVIAVDASLAACKLASKVVDRMRLDNVELHHVGIADFEGSLAFPQNSISLDNRFSFDVNEQQIRVTTVARLLSDLGITKVNLLKMNIEGAEKLAITKVPLEVVENTVVSCHDFTGDPEQVTLLAVSEELQRGGHIVSRDLTRDPLSCEGNYLYSKLQYGT